MLTIPVERVNIERFDEAGAFYSVALKRHPNNPLNRFLNEDKTIQASKMLSEFRDAVKEALGKLQCKSNLFFINILYIYNICYTVSTPDMTNTIVVQKYLNVI